MKTLKSIVVGLALGYNALACGPDAVENHYYTQEENHPSDYPSDNTSLKPQNPSINGSCEEAAAKEIECYFRDGGWPHEQLPFHDPVKRQSFLTGKCQNSFPQECINCMVSAPCTFVPNNDVPSGKPYWFSPLHYCTEVKKCSG